MHSVANFIWLRCVTFMFLKSIKNDDLCMSDLSDLSDLTQLLITKTSKVNKWVINRTFFSQNVAFSCNLSINHYERLSLRLYWYCR